MTATVTELRTPRYNPALQRHSWQRLREHTYQCRYPHCRIVKVKHEVGRGRWAEEWLWPGSVAGADTTESGRFPPCPYPYATPVTIPAGSVGADGRQLPNGPAWVVCHWSGPFVAADEVGPWYDLVISAGRGFWYRTVPDGLAVYTAAGHTVACPLPQWQVAE